MTEKQQKLEAGQLVTRNRASDANLYVVSEAHETHIVVESLIGPSRPAAVFYDTDHEGQPIFYPATRAQADYHLETKKALLKDREEQVKRMKETLKLVEEAVESNFAEE